MKDLLIVDDDQFKTNEMIELLKRTKQNINVTVEKTLNSGLRRLRNEIFDIILLDMSMPTFDATDSSNYNSFGGILFLEEMKRKRNSTPVIIVTQYELFGEGPGRKTSDAIDEECKRTFKNYKGIVIYSSIQNSWKEQLLKMLGD